MGMGREEGWLVAHGFQRVHVELDRYDGPWKGLADVDGVPHYFERIVGGDDAYLAWPAAETAIMWERESWAIYIQSLDGHEHPAIGGVHPRFDELELLLEPHRAAPVDARTLIAEWQFDDTDERYRLDGIDQWVRWTQPLSTRPPTVVGACAPPATGSSRS